MKNPRVASVLTPVIVFGLSTLVSGLSTPAVMADQGGASGQVADSRVTLRTPWGEPDLQGIWNGDTLTPLERPARWANKPVLPPNEAAAVERWVTSRVGRDDRSRKGTERDVAAAYNEHWLPPPQKLSDGRTGLIVDPADGRIPPMTADALKRTSEVREYLRALLDGTASGRPGAKI